MKLPYIYISIRLIRADIATDEMDAVVCTERRVAKYLASATNDGALKLTVLVHRRHLASEHVLKPPFGNGLSNLALSTISFQFLGRLNIAIGGSLKRSTTLLLV